MKKERKTRKPHPIWHAIGTLFSTVFLVLVVVLNVIASGFQPTLDAFVGGVKADVSEEERAETVEDAIALAEIMQQESTVLLRNENKTLPLDADTKNINVFGWASTEWIGGGSGSGGVNSVEVDLLKALEESGFTYNTELTDMYTAFQEAREYTSTLNSWPEESCRLYEPNISDTRYYSKELLAHAEQFSDTALVVIGRLAGESSDCTLQQYKRIESAGEIVEDSNRTYLNLSTEEIALLNYVGKTYENVVVLLNTGNVMALGELETIPGIDACLMVGYTGQYGASAIPALLMGEVTPSGKTADTWAYDFSTAPSYANAAADGVGMYTNAEGLYPYDGTTCGNLGETYAYEQVSYLDYAEGIYVGYKWYETADAEGYWGGVKNEYGEGYEGVVQYPFGYGLSYTDFDWEITEASEKPDNNEELSVTVRVTNKGNVAGADVVQMYYTAPYMPNEIEKSAVELVAFEKTDILNPGESQDIELNVGLYDMASYDAYDANQNGFVGYELDEGEYSLSIRRDAHTVEATIPFALEENIQYPTDPVTGLVVENKFTGVDAVDGVSVDGSDSAQNITYMTRADFAGTFPKENVESRLMAENVAEWNLYTEELANAWIDETDEAIVTGAQNDMKVQKNGALTELGIQLGTDYNDPQWDALLDQLTIEEMQNLVLHGYGHTASVDSVGKTLTKDADGPAQIGGFTGMGAGTGFSNSATLAQSWNTDLSRQIGRMIGKQAAQSGYSGWYAPAVNMHRSPFNGRNYEYYSEDSYLSGVMCGNTVAGAKESGTFCYVKHFLCNDGESGIYRDSIYIWMTEQALREIYLEPFRIIVEEYGATGLMSSYNRIGAVWAGGSKALLTGILRDEWNFEGVVITDYSDHHEFMNGDQMIRAGGDLWMDGVLPGSLKYETESNSFQQAMRRASKNIIYMYLNAQVENINYVNETGDVSAMRAQIDAEGSLWKTIIIIVDIVAVLLFVLALHALIRDIKIIHARKREILE